MISHLARMAAVDVETAETPKFILWTCEWISIACMLYVYEEWFFFSLRSSATCTQIYSELIEYWVLYVSHSPGTVFTRLQYVQCTLYIPSRRLIHFWMARSRFTHCSWTFSVQITYEDLSTSLTDHLGNNK